MQYIIISWHSLSIYNYILEVLCLHLSKFFGETEPVGYMWSTRRKWFVWLWRHRSPTICCLKLETWCYHCTLRLKTREPGSWWYKSQCKGRRRPVSQLSRQARRKRVQFLLLMPFVPFRPSIDGMQPTHVGVGNLNASIQVLTSPIHPEIMLNLGFSGVNIFLAILR